MYGSLPFSKAFDFASGETTSRFTNPFWKFKEFFLGRNLRRAIAEVHSYGRTVVAEAVRKRSAKSTEKHSPLQSNLIDSLLDHLPSEDLVADAAMNFLSAGRDTTAQSLTWTFYNLMRHPSIVPILREELASLLPDPSPDPSNSTTTPSPPPLPLTYDTVQPPSLPYTLALFSEVIRLYPPVPFELKESTAPTTFPDGTFLPANSIVLWVPWAMGRSTLIWGNDALVFRPARWLDHSASASTESRNLPDRSQGSGPNVPEASRAPASPPSEGAHPKPTLLAVSAYANPVFNAGPRTCLGKKMAELLAVYVIAALVWEYEFEEVREKGVGERVSQNSLTLPMEGGLPVRVRRRVV